MPIRPLRLLATCLAAVVCLPGCRHSYPYPPNSTPELPRHVSARVPAAAPAPYFVDVAKSAGIRYQWKIEGKRPVNILQSIGNGCAFLDFDNDGNLDILLVGTRPALYRGDGHGHFTDVTHATGLDGLIGHFLGCAVGDYDNDGFPDIYLSAYRGGALLHNEEGSRRSK